MKPLLCVALFALAGCQSTSAEPLARGIIVGEFGGPSAFLVADSTRATFDLGCAEVSVASPLMTDDRGEFIASGLRRRLGGAPPFPGETPTPVRLEGRATTENGGTLRVVIQSIPGDAAASTTVIVVRNRPTTLLRCP